VKTIVVLSMHRTGSSLVANLLHNALGVSMGQRFLGRGPWNKQGVWEDIAFVSLNKSILRACGTDYQTGWKHPPDRDKVLALGERERWVERIRELVQSRRGLWGWKDPRTCLTIPLYHPYLENPHYVCTVRRHEDIIKSLEKRGIKKHGQQFWQELIQRYESDRTRFLHEVDAPCLTVCFERFVSKKLWKDEVEMLAKFVEVETDMKKARNIIQWK